MRLEARLRRLEAARPDPGCRACQGRQRIVLVECQRERDDSVTPLEPLPAPCAACGCVPEFVVQIIRTYDGPQPATDQWPPPPGG
jgi:hypothetical protein